MSSPRIVQLSKALYSDAPLKEQYLREWPCSSSRKRGHTYVAPAFETRKTSRSTLAVRLLLPRAFSIADRELCAAADVVRERNAGGPSSTLVTSVASLHTGLEPTRADAIGIAVGVDGVSRCQPECCCLTTPSQEPDQRHPSGQTPTAAAGGAVMMVVVESFLGFMAVRALLDQSYQHGAACNLASSQPVKDGSDGAAEQDDSSSRSSSSSSIGGATQGRDDSRREGEESFDAPAVAQTVRRLVGWLRLAGETAALEGCSKVRANEPYGLSPSIGTRRLLDESNRRAPVGRKRRETTVVVARDDEELWSAPSSERQEEEGDASLYEVTGRCDAGREWSVFMIEPATAGGQGKPRTRRGAHLGGRALEVKLICHPLVTMAPDIRWCLRLIGQAKAVACLLNANAKLSTLGGGYFLTRQVGQAIRLARAQSQVATALGDMQLAGKCHINEAYNYIWLGQYAQASRIIRAQVNASRATDDTELETVAAIAACFLRRSKKANHHLLQSHAAASGDRGGSNDGGSRGWVRQRIDVKTDEWHRVRALPMYCSSERATAVGWEEGRGQQGLPQM